MHSFDSQNHAFITAMDRLVQYIEHSYDNKKEIFAALSQNDIRKIIQNFSNQNAQLRKLSLKMIGLLLNNNTDIKLNFCTKMQIGQIPGKICLNFNTQRNIQLSPEKSIELIKLLKEPIKRQDSQFLLWIINLRKTPLSIDFVPISALNYVDPLDLIIGFILPQIKTEQKPFKLFSLFQNVNTCVPRINKNQDFEVKPATQRHSSNSSQVSKRFNRTSNKKTSLKQHSTRNSASKINDQNLDSSKAQSKEKYSMKYSQFSRIQSTYTPQKQKSQFAKSTQNSINQFKSIRKMHNLASSSIIKGSEIQTQKQKQKNLYQPIINNTNIYISTPIKSIQIDGQKVQLKTQQNDVRLNGTKFVINENHQQNNQNNQNNYHKIYPQTTRNTQYTYSNITKLSYTPIINNNSTSQGCQIIIKPIQKYQRVTTRNDNKIQNTQYQNKFSSVYQNKDRDFDFNKYRQFINRVGNNTGSMISQNKQKKVHFGVNSTVS